MTGVSAIARSEPNCFNNCRANSTALVPLKPTRINMATNSASVNACAPFDKSRSRGRSSCGQDAMPVVFVLDAGIQLRSGKKHKGDGERICGIRGK